MPTIPLKETLTDVRAALLLSAGLTALVVDRVFRFVAHQNETLPYVVLNVITNRLRSTLDRDASASDLFLQIDVYASSGGSCLDVADAIISQALSLNQVQGDTDIQAGLVVDEGTSYEEEETRLHRARLEFDFGVSISP